MRVTVIGIGQTLRGDDAAGIEAVRLWETAFPHTALHNDVSVQYSELPGLALLDMLDGFDGAVIVDAVESGGQPGKVHRIAQEELAAFTAGSKSAHGWGVAETLELGRQLNPAREMHIRLVGIQAGQMELGQPMSAAVQEALEAASRAIEAEVQALLG